MNDNDKTRDNSNYVFLSGIIQTDGIDGLKKWFNNQSPNRQDYVVELLESLSKDFNKLLQENRKPTASIHKFPTKFRVINGKKA